MIEILQEVTDWGDINIANGIYHVNGAGQLVQYNDKVFNSPMKQFSKSRRKFTKIGEREEALAPGVKTVQGRMARCTLSMMVSVRAQATHFVVNVNMWRPHNGFFRNRRIYCTSILVV